jgi:hypothetical protein
VTSIFRFTELGGAPKIELPIYLCVYRLMPDHVHLLIEIREDPII